MFETFDNAGNIRINFHSDDNTAERINTEARKQGSVPVTSPILMGGYGFPVLEDLAQGRPFQVLKTDLPGDSVQHFLEIEHALGDQDTVYAYVDAGHITIVQIAGWDKSVESLGSNGWSVLSGQKTFKRIKTLNRPFRTWAKLDRPLRVHIVEDDAYTDMDTEGLDPDTIERLLDGAFVIAPWIRAECMTNVQFLYEVSEEHGYNVDDFRREMFVRRASKVEAWNARFFGPMIFSGIRADDPLHERPGMLKGEAFVHTSDICELMKCDVIATRSALKAEVSCDSRTYILMEAQSPKLDGIVSDFQTMVNLPALYQPDDVMTHTKAFLLKAFKGLTEDKLLDYWYEMTSPLFNRQTAMYDMQDVATLTKWNARAWVMSGLSINQSPWLFEQLANSIVSSLRPNDRSKLRFPVLCAIRCQVISNSYAGMAGHDVEVEPGQARYIEELESIVVCDDDWIEMYRSHGGQDLDDFFVCYYRTIGDQRKIILVRSPNDFGEYSVMDYVEGDFYPTFEDHEDNLIAFPVVDEDPNMWPKRLSVAFEDGDLTYRGLPSENEEPVDSEAEFYGMNDVLMAIENNKASQACVGANVNARSLWSLTARRHRELQLTTMEGCIDAGAQGGSAVDTEAVMAEAHEIVEQIVRDEVGEIDAYVWTTRFAAIHKYPFPMERLSTDGYISRADQFRQEYVTHFTAMARRYAQNNCVNKIDPVVHTLGQLFAHSAYRLLLSSRMFMVNAQRKDDESIDLGAWSAIHAPVKRALDAQVTDIDRHNLILALYSNCHKVPTSTTGRYSDQIVMNPEIFPYLLDALRFYGLAAYIRIDDNGKPERKWASKWDLACTGCGAATTTENPVVLQAFHYYEGKCKQCR